MFDDNLALFNGLIDLIEKWNPIPFSNEKQYQEDLYGYLCDLQDRGAIKSHRRILRERGTNRADIVIDDKIAIELKKDLKHQPSVDRCVAQIKRMKNEYNFVIVVIVGESNSRQHITLLKHELQEFLQNDGIFGNEKSIKVVNIGDKRTPKESNYGIFGNTDFSIKGLI